MTALQTERQQQVIEVIEDEAERQGFGYIQRDWDDRRSVEEIRLQSIAPPLGEAVFHVDEQGHVYSSHVATTGAPSSLLMIPDDYVRDAVRKAAVALGVALGVAR